MSKDNGGPAFGELQQVGDVAMRDGGLSIRDYFAAHASEQKDARVAERLRVMFAAAIESTNLGIKVK